MVYRLDLIQDKSVDGFGTVGAIAADTDYVTRSIFPHLPRALDVPLTELSHRISW